MLKQNGSSGNHSREGTYYDHHASLRGTERSIDHNIGSDIALGLDTEDTVPEHIASNDIIKPDRKQKRRDQYMARRNRLTPEQKEEINARRREARKKTEEERTARQREARQRMTPEEKQQSNTLRRAAYQNMMVEDKQERNSCRRASYQNMPVEENQERNYCRRVAYQNMTDEEKQETNARRRARVQNIPPKEKQKMLAQRNAILTARRNIPCAESIAMPRPDAATLATPNLMSTTHARDPAASTPSPQLASKAGYSFESDGNPPIFTLLVMSMCVGPVFTSSSTMQASTLVVPWTIMRLPANS